MRVKLSLELDVDGVHSLTWEPNEADGAVEVPKALLERWAAEREAFRIAHLRWKRVAEEIEDYLHAAEEQHGRPSRHAQTGSVSVRGAPSSNAERS